MTYLRASHLTLSVLLTILVPVLTLGQTAPGSLLNISTRLRIHTPNISAQSITAGFIIQGPPGATKKVLIRAIGPSLAQHGILNPLPDTALSLFNASNQPIAGNRHWRDTQEAEIKATTIPPGYDAEAAILATLPVGAYTAILYADKEVLPAASPIVNGVPFVADGLGLVEVYDVDSSFTAQLGNISTIGYLETGQDVMISGFIAGPGPRKVLVQADGPSLGTGPGYLQDPILVLYNANGDVIGSNDNWQESQRGEIEATTIPPADPRESAILLTLPAGAYTAVLRGKNQEIGYGLIALYAVD